MKFKIAPILLPIVLLAEPTFAAGTFAHCETGYLKASLLASRFRSADEILKDPHGYWVELTERAKRFTAETGKPAYRLPLPEQFETVHFMEETLSKYHSTFQGTDLEPLFDSVVREIERLKQDDIPYEDYLAVTRHFAEFMHTRRTGDWLIRLRKSEAFKRYKKGEAEPFEGNGSLSSLTSLDLHAFPKKVFLPLDKNLTLRNLVRCAGAPIAPIGLSEAHPVFGTMDLYDHDIGHYLAGEIRNTSFLKSKAPFSEEAVLQRQKYFDLNDENIKKILDRSTQLPTKEKRMAIDYVLFYLFHEKYQVDTFNLLPAIEVLLMDLRGQAIPKTPRYQFPRAPYGDYWFGSKTILMTNYMSETRGFLGPWENAEPLLTEALEWLETNLKELHIGEGPRPGEITDDSLPRK